MASNQRYCEASSEWRFVESRPFVAVLDAIDARTIVELVPVFTIVGVRSYPRELQTAKLLRTTIFYKEYYLNLQHLVMVVRHQ